MNPTPLDVALYHLRHFLSSSRQLTESKPTAQPEDRSTILLLMSTAALPRHGKGSWDEEKKEKVQGEETSRGKAVATRGVDSELRLNRKQQDASTTLKASLIIKYY
ncbi:hypothetical protein L1987_23855 [Smallanthus sonchifolius]|uniref:Uncharacterized protein n=1 Tax=Smallanthus sonchifolius TaxID=185202 RepID=A0ACB9IJF2_9ASTR|nr:hypothetical protein L1987_23855 [Smallanthus sonchifolius]